MTDRPVVVAVALGRVRRRWPTLVLIGLLAGLIGGVATASVSGARRSSTAYDRLVEATDFPDAFLQLIEPAPGLPEQVAASPAVERSVPSIFAVGREASRRNQVLVPVQAAEEPISDLVVVRGRAPDPAAAHEVTLSEAFSSAIGFDVGDTFAYEGLTRDEFADLFRDRWDGSASGLRIDLEVVGVTRSPTDAVLGDFPTLIGTPALLDRFDGSVPDALGLWIHLRDGATTAQLRADLARTVGQESVFEITDLTLERRKVDDAVVVLVWGLMIFGVVSALAGSVVLAQLVARSIERSGDEGGVLRDLGVGRRARLLAAAAPGLVSVAVAVVSTAVVAVAASRWTPIGVARRVEPAPGVEWNLVALAVGPVACGSLLAVLFLACARRRRPRRPAPVGRFAGATSQLLQAGPIGSVAAVSAFGAGRRVATGRIAFAGVVASTTGLVAVALFGASLGRLADEPARWGALGDHLVEVPEPVRERTYEVLGAAEEIDAFAELQGSTVTIRGRRLDAYRFDARRGDIAPVVVSGNLPASPAEVALGPSLLDSLGIEVGQRLEVDGAPVRVVGSVLTFGLSDRSSVTEGVLLGGPARTPPEFTTLVVRYVDGVDPARAAARLYGDLEYFAPARPTDVTNLAALRPLAPLLLVLLGVIGTAALIHLAVGIGSRGRRDLAVLRSLGFAPGSAARVVAVATALVVAAATAIGVPLGAVLGRSVWTTVAATTDLAADVTVPPQLVAGVAGLAALTLSAGAWSGRRAARRPVPEVLRAE